MIELVICILDFLWLVIGPYGMIHECIETSHFILENFKLSF